MKNRFTIFTAALAVAAIVLFAYLPAFAGYNHEMMNPEVTTATAAASLPAKCRLLADDVTNLRPIFIDCAEVAGLNSSPIAGSFTTLTTTGAITVDSVVVNRKQLTLPGRVDITICGDGTTINNNTVYYGPSMVPVAGAGRTCDITQAGNTTEATADEPALDATAFQVLSMDCLTADPGASGVSFTLRSAAAASTPSVTCSVANTKKGCTANVQTTTAIASGATIAIAAASAGNQGTTPFVCTIHAAY